MGATPTNFKTTDKDEGPSPLNSMECAKVYRYAHDGAAARRGRGECEVPPLEIEVRAMQLSPYRAGLAGRHGTRLPVPPAFPTCSCPLQLPPSGESMTQESPFERDCLKIGPKACWQVDTFSGHLTGA